MTTEDIRAIVMKMGVPENKYHSETHPVNPDEGWNIANELNSDESLKKKFEGRSLSFAYDPRSSTLLISLSPTEYWRRIESITPYGC